MLLDQINGQLFLNRSDHTEYIHTEYHISSEAYTYGLLVKYQDEYDYMIDFIKDNRLLLEICTLERYRSHHVCYIFLINIKLKEEINLSINYRVKLGFRIFFLAFNSFIKEVPIYIKSSPLICRANQWTCFYMIETSVMKELILS